MPKWLKLDWLMLVIAFAGLLFTAAPYFQSPDYSIDVQLISQSALQPLASKDKALGLEITIDKVPVNDPYLSVIQLVNTGNKPISSRDFESPIEISIGESKRIIRAQVTGVSPKDLKPVIKFDTKQIQLQPMLLNSHDTITLAILSADGIPNFHPSARIAGIESIKLSLLDKEKLIPYFTPILIALVFITTIASNAMTWRFEITSNKIISISRGTSLISNALLLYLALFLIVILLPRLGLESLWFLLPMYLAASAITLPFVIWLERRPSKPTRDVVDQTV